MEPNTLAHHDPMRQRKNGRKGDGTERARIMTPPQELGCAYRFSPSITAPQPLGDPTVMILWLKTSFRLERP